MQKLTQRIPVAFGLALAVGLVGFTGLTAQEEEQPAQEEEITCRATLAPASIMTEEQPAIVQVAFSEEIGTTTDVRAQDGSGLEVIKVEKPKEPEKVAEAEGEQEYEEAVNIPAYDVQLQLNATASEGGEWLLHFEGTEGACVGTVQVVAPPEDTPEEGVGEPPLR